MPGVRTQVVILSQVLACDATLGYEDLFNTQVLKFNGEPLLCLSLNEALGSYSVPLEGFPEQITLLMLLNSFFLGDAGAPVRNLRHLTQLTAACTEPFMRFDLDYNVRPTVSAVHASVGMSCAAAPCRAAYGEYVHSNKSNRRGWVCPRHVKPAWQATACQCRSGRL